MIEYKCDKCDVVLETVITQTERKATITRRYVNMIKMLQGERTPTGREITFDSYKNFCVTCFDEAKALLVVWLNE